MIQPIAVGRKGKSLAPGHPCAIDGEQLPVVAIIDPPPVIRTLAGFHVIGYATVQAAPYRSVTTARQLAERIASKPTSYLPLLMWFAVPGVADVRPWFARVTTIEQGMEVRHAG